MIVAGQKAFRAIDVSHRRAAARWRFSPPPGYRFDSNDVTVPLGDREGFFVVEARRGDAVQQVWINRTRIGLVTKESPDSLLVWCVDLGSGHALRNIPVDFLVGTKLITKKTGGDGSIDWRGARPQFALASMGASRAFVSFLPQAPLPANIVGVRLESETVAAGGSVRAIGFARKHTTVGYRPASGDAHVTIVGRGKTIASATAHLDASGAFSIDVPLPAATTYGDYAVLANVGGAVGGTSVHVDAGTDVVLSVVPQCPCTAAADLTSIITAKRGLLPAAHLPLVVRVVRSPHVLPPGESDATVRWGTTVVAEYSLTTDDTGHASFMLAAPTDGLSTTYGIRVTGGSAVATTRVSLPTAKIALAVEPDTTTADIGESVGFEVRGFDTIAGAPAANLPVTLRLSHGAIVQVQTLTLDDRGRAHAIFRAPELGNNLAVAEAMVGTDRVLDASAVLVAPSVVSGAATSAESGVVVHTDRQRFRPTDQVNVSAQFSGANGDALLSLEGARTYGAHVVANANGTASASFDLRDAAGDTNVAAAFVTDGAIVIGSAGVNIDGPGHPRQTDLTLDHETYAAGAPVHVVIHDGDLRGGATLAIRLTDARATGAAFFDDAAGLLAIGGTTTQVPSSPQPSWHTWVAPAHSRVFDILSGERSREAPAEDLSLGTAAPRTLLWRVERADASSDAIDIVAPKEKGRYVLSLLKISDDGDVGAASVGVIVQ